MHAPRAQSLWQREYDAAGGLSVAGRPQKWITNAVLNRHRQVGYCFFNPVTNP
jgi:hypothetical protein